MVISLIRRISDYGVYRPILLCFSDSDLYEYACQNYVECIGIKAPFGIKGWIKFMYEYYGLVHKFRGRVVINDIFSHILLFLYPWRKKEIFVSHGGDYKSHGREFAAKSGRAAKIAKITFKRVAQFIAVSPTQKEALVFNAGVSDAKVKVITNGFDRPSCINVKTNISAHRKHICMVGYIKPLKNQLEIIKAINLLIKKGKDCVLHIYGSVSDAKYEAEILDYVANNNLKNNVIFYGFCSDKDKIYSNKDMLISASFHEGFGLNIIEAMAYGVPTIAFEGSKGPASIIINNKTGLLAHVNSAEQYAELIEKYIGNESFRQSIVHNAMEEYLKKYSMHTMVENYIRAFNLIYI